MTAKLELTWVGKENHPRIEPRILVEDPAKSYHAKTKVTDNDIFDNRLIFGDNLLALKALEQEFAGMVRCIFIDPPYNTGSAFSHYDDGIEHSLWLTLMRDRIELLRKLLSKDGSLWITIDDTECHYLKVLCDEIFGRSNFVANVIWHKKSSIQANAIWFTDAHDHLLVYAKDKTVWRPKLLPRTEKADARYSNPDNDSRGIWTSGPCTISLTSGQRGAQFARTGQSSNLYEIITPSGRRVLPPRGTCWRYSKEKFDELIQDNRIFFGSSGNNVPRLKRFLSDVQGGIVPTTIWSREDAGDNWQAKNEVLAFNSESVFSTPKPEKLLMRIIHLATEHGDLILDSFAGSGTTGAVAHKMGRRWIMVELGEHCHTHIIPRLKKVIDGEDKGGITEAVEWTGGGGFRYYTPASSLLKKDEFGNWIISKEYNPAMLSEAVCKLEGYRYMPSDTVYWQHGSSSEDSFIFVTTQTLTVDQLRHLNDEVGPKRSLLICCGSFIAKNLSDYPRLIMKKIPKAVLHKCEWGHDDYSLEIKNLPVKAIEPKSETPKKSVTKEERRKSLTLLDFEGA